MEIIELSWAEFEVAIDKLTRWLDPIADGRAIYAPPRGGLPIAVALSHRLNIPLVTTITSSIQKLIWVDDLIDTGITLQRARENLTGKNVRYCSWVNRLSPEHALSVLLIDESEDVRVVFPWECVDQLVEDDLHNL